KALRLDQLLHEVVGPTIIYSATRAACETLAIRLQKAGHAAAFYHAGLDRHQRDLIQRQFQSDQLQIICATSAFGMGIDKANVRFVVHTYVPESLEAYYQAIGRAGRDGKQSLAALLVTDHDVQHGAILAGMLPDA
ncbi:helicase-related protein, partial [Streptococcus thermophilus]|nr:ATP-dependent DNA helicase RecQ [Streptococcus thermophilus]